MWRRLLSTCLLTGAIVLVGPAISAQVASPCAATLPDGDWQLAGQTDLVAVYGAGLTQALGLRLADGATTTARMLEADFGSLPPLTVCVIGFQVDVDTTPLTGGQGLFHSAVLNDEGTVFVSMIDGAYFDEAHAFGMASAVLWHEAAAMGLDGYPEPLATTIGQWYISRSAKREGLDHAQMRNNAFFIDPGGEGIEPADWAVSSQTPTLAWNPEFQASPVADMIGYAVAQHGIEVLDDPDPLRWAEIEVAWQADLRDEALQGRESGNRWVFGLGIVVGAVALGAITAWLTRRSRRRHIAMRKEAAKRHAAGVPEEATHR